METKKTQRADLERRRILFFEMGMVISLALTLTAFEKIGSRDADNSRNNRDYTPEPQEWVIPTMPEKPELPPPPAEKIGINIELVDNGVITEDFTPIELIGEEYYNNLVEVDEPADEPDVPDDIIIDWADVEPAFPGGDEALFEFIRNNIVYPRPAREAKIEGKVVVEFVVEPSGKLSNINVIRKVAPSLDEEAVRVVKMLPAWEPGKQRGKAVRTRFRLPIVFQLN